MDNFSTYVNELEEIRVTASATEHSYRGPLQKLVRSLGNNIQTLNEPRKSVAGIPDLRVSRGNVRVGYIETKAIGKPLDEIEQSDQLLRYRKELGNLILTDYLQFRWYVGGKPIHRATLATVGKGGKLKLADDAPQAAVLLDQFLRSDALKITSPKELAAQMANYAKIIRGEIERQLNDNEAPAHPRLQELLRGFRSLLLKDLDNTRFADMYAQTVCYGLFAARINHQPGEKFSRRTAFFEVPANNPFLSRFYEQIGGRALEQMSFIAAVDELAALLGQANVDDILRDFGKGRKQEDPIFHFYETFLDAYDPKLREERGVYYTPQPVIAYIVSSVNRLLKERFDLPDGLADRSKVKSNLPQDYDVATASPGFVATVESPVYILDPAVGTGTFLAEVIRQIHAEVASGNPGGWPSYVSQHLIPRLYGFELLMAPYTIAHLQLSLLLKETGYNPTAETSPRLNIYLTNTLSEAQPQRKLELSEYLAEEANAANAVKRDQPVMVILGNPPYSGHSTNKGDWIEWLLHGESRPFASRQRKGFSDQNIPAEWRTASYFHVDGEPLNEQNPKWLNDDYVKFIRFAQWRIERTGKGVLAFISNNGYLDNPTFRGMRESLLHTFDDIYILNLHGNSKKQERSPDGSPDQNVFDIQQGVCIGIFVKNPTASNGGRATLHYADLWGTRAKKFDCLSRDDCGLTEWQPVSPNSPFYLFTPQDTDVQTEYERGWSVKDVMPSGQLGVTTSRDNFAIAFTESDLVTRLNGFMSTLLSTQEAKERYLSQKDKLDVGAARIGLSTSDWRQQIQPCLYRPFDERFMIHHDAVIERSRREVMQHMSAGANLALVTARGVEIGTGWEHVLCTSSIIQLHSVSIKEVNYLFPLYIYPTTPKPKKAAARQQVGLSGMQPGGPRQPNLAPGFIAAVSDKLGWSFVPDGKGDLQQMWGPEDVFNYMYAVFHSPEYRRRYAGLLKIDFPRLPLTANRELFKRLAVLGGQLVGLHLMQPQPRPKLIAGYYSNSTDMLDRKKDTVEQVRYDDKEQQVWVNKVSYFAPVSPAVWEFQIGGYKVAEKWLKDRKGRVLDYDDLEHYRYIVTALAETQGLMAEIDEVIEEYGGWPLS